MWANRFLILSVAATLGAGAVRADAPLSAIDWLSQSVATPAPSGQALPSLPPTRPALKPQAWQPGTISVAPIGAAGPDTLGLVPPERSGLPPTFWGNTPSEDLARQLAAEPADTLPAMQALLTSLLVTGLNAPADGDPKGVLFLARVDKLLDLGALDPALALLEQLNSSEPEPFRRWFDISLLLGQEDHACEMMAKNPEIAPTFPARIFCLARQGDWPAAAISLRAGRALGTLDGPTADLLARFLDPDLFEGDPPLPMPERPSPLTFRMMEAIDEPIATATLPPAFAQADLRSNNGWKARLEAGERLARTGAISPNRLLGLYTEQRQAASGGVWDRVEAVQAFEAALKSRDKAKLATAQTAVWGAMQQQGLEVPFAQLFGARLAAAGLTGAPGALAFRIGLLSDDCDKVAEAHKTTDPGERFLAAIASGAAPEQPPADPLGQAVAAAFAADVTPDERFVPLLQGGRTGEAVLRAIDMLAGSAAGDLRDVTAGLQLLRQVGLEVPARRAALELLLLERRG